MQPSVRRPFIAGTFVLLAGCIAGSDLSLDADPDELAARDLDSSELGVDEQGLSAECGGDDSNALTAALAVAIANELGRWDVNTDFMISNGKLELSATGALHCGSGCGNIKDLLRLQDDASSVITNHGPATFRGKLTSWYNAQKTKLQTLVTEAMTRVDKGIYRIRPVHTAKYLVPSAGSSSSGVALQQSDQFNTSTASQWRIVLRGTAHQIVNVKSGLCADLSYNSTSYPIGIVQRACNGSSTQAFRFSQTSSGAFFVRPGNAPGAGDQTRTWAISNGSTANGAGLVQSNFTPSQAYEQFLFEPFGAAPHVSLLTLGSAVYTIKAGHSGMYVGVSSGSLTDGASVVQQSYVSTDDRFNWYLSPRGVSRYQLINRRTGSCLDLQYPGSSTGKLVQRRCSTDESQVFYFTPTGEGSYVLWTKYGVTVDVPGGSLYSGTQLAQGGKTWQTYNKLGIEPVMAGETHRLTLDRIEPGGPCGDYYWYDVSHPNGTPLDDPSSTYVQLVFAGGKQTPGGADANPFIAQLVDGSQVAVDPTVGLYGSGSTAPGSCRASCVQLSSTNIVGQCCSCNAAYKAFVKSAWSATTFVCQ